MRQRTIKNSFSLTGIGIHSGKEVNAEFLPAKANSGINFEVPFNNMYVTIPASSNLVIDSTLCSKIGNELVSVNTIEHIMAALNALNIDNILVKLTSNEFPILDGGSAFLFDSLKECGIKKQAAFKMIYVVVKEVKVSLDDKFARYSPDNKCCYSFFIDFSDRGFAARHFDFTLNEQDFRVQIASARTFGFKKDHELLTAQNFALGANLHNTLVLGDATSENFHNFLTAEDEMVRHKILDAIGDTYLIGKRILGHYYGHKSSHKLNAMLIKELIAQDAVKLMPYDMVIKSKNRIPKFIPNPAGILSLLKYFNF